MKQADARVCRTGGEMESVSASHVSKFSNVRDVGATERYLMDDACNILCILRLFILVHFLSKRVRITGGLRYIHYD